MTTTIDDITETFSLIDDWEERYRYVIDLGRHAPPFPEEARTEENRVLGCASQVWLVTHAGEGPDPVLTFEGDSDAHIVRGLVAIIVAFYSGKRASEILARDATTLFAELGLSEHLTPQRSNGVRSMVQRIRRDATDALAR